MFHHQETFWRIPVNLNPEKLRRAAKDLEGSGVSENGEGMTVGQQSLRSFFTNKTFSKSVAAKSQSPILKSSGIQSTK